MKPDCRIRTNNFCQEVENILISNSTELRKRNGHLPDVFYIGLGKTGSSTLTKGLSGCTTAHWHHGRHFEILYKTDILTKSKLDIYDVPEVLGKEYNYRPLIVECYREPLGQHLSAVFHRVRQGSFLSSDPLEIANFAKKSVHDKQPLALKTWGNRYCVDILNMFDINKKYLFARKQHVNLLFLRLEDSSVWPAIFNSLGYTFNLSHTNAVSESEFHELYASVKELYKFSRSELDHIYGNEVVRALYTVSEIEKFKEKYGNT